MRTKFNGILTLLLAFVVQITFAQEKVVSGTVSDDSGPLPGVTILKKGTTTSGTETDFDGNYSIKVNTGDVLVFSFVGMETVEKTIGASDRLDVVLQSDNLLEEVVVVGYGTTTKKAYAGTATQVSQENLEAKSFANVSQALAGEVAGVQVINSSGQPGSIGTVRVRGYGSPLGNRNPLYVVDGIPFSGTFDLNSINPADIKSTTVLKDATATAIYGSRGANGVILITTKTGSSNEKAQVETEFKSGINYQGIARYDVLTSPEEYIGLVWEGLYNRGVTTNNADPVAFANATLLGDNGIGNGYNMWNVATAAELIDPSTRSVRPGVQRLFTPERYADAAFGTGVRTETNVRFSGGSQKSKYFFSAGYLNDKGYSLNSDYKRYTTRMNLNSDVKEWLKVGVSLGYNYSEQTNNGQIAGSENVFEFADKMAPIYPVYARYPNSAELIPDPLNGGYQFDYGTPTGTQNGFVRSRPNANLLNPIGSATFDFDGDSTHSLNGNVNLTFKITEDLSFETKFGGQYSYLRRNDMTNHMYGTGANTNGQLNNWDVTRWSKTFLQLLRYRKSFGDHNLEVLAAHESFETMYDQNIVFLQGVIVPGFFNNSNYTLTNGNPSGYRAGSAIESYFSQANYNFRDKYFLTGSLRTDGSSNFNKEKWGTFGSVGAAWVVSEEDFLQNSFISYLKAKVSWGITGDQQGAAGWRGYNTYNANLIGGGLSLAERIPGNQDLTWETSEMFQTGLEMSFGQYLDVDLDYYIKDTDNLFNNQVVGPSAGIASVRVNDGEVRFSGFEFNVDGHLVNTDNFKLDLSVNGEVLNNEFRRLPIDATSGQPKIIDTGSSPDGNYAYAQGRSIFDFYLREWAGVDPTDGAPTWVQYYDDQNENGVLDDGEESFSVLDENGQELNNTQTLYEYRQLVPGANIQTTTTREYSDATQVFNNKSFIPDVRGAFRLAGKLKSFDFSTQFTYSLGGYAYDAQYAELMSDRFGAAGNNFHSDILQRWQQPGDVTDVPLLADNAVVNGTSGSTRFITSTDYIALNNARIGYTVPSTFMPNSGIDLINLWVAGDNLFVNTAREGFNPQAAEAGNSGRRQYAPATTITFGVRVKF